jgi:hypothetical protein
LDIAGDDGVVDQDWSLWRWRPGDASKIPAPALFASDSTLSELEIGAGST